MTYQGPPGYASGYPPGHGQPGNYEGQPPMGTYLSPQMQQTEPSTGAYLLPQMQQAAPPGAYTQGRISMEQIQQMKARNEAAYHQQNQYGQILYANNQPMYYQAPPIQSQQPQQPQSYSQYIHPQQQQHLPVQTITPQYDGSYDKPNLSAPPPQQHLPRQQPNSQNGAPILPGSKPRKSSKPKAPTLKAVDPHTLLPALAEEYFKAAYNLGLATAQRMDTDAVTKYQKLIATGLGCLEAALAGRLEPRLEAKIRLRYGSVLLDETDNMMEAETALSKGITLCDQNRYFDLKYNMQVLLAKLMFTKSPKAALKALDKNVADVEAYQHHSWIYVFRFLRATLSLQSGRSSDANAALHNLRSIAKTAHDRGDHAVLTAASLMEALASLHAPGPDSVENVDRALAAARMYQLDPACNIVPLQAFGHIVDVAASLLHSTEERTLPKLKAMQTMINDAYTDTAAWNRSNDAIHIPLNRKQGDAHISSQDTSGVLKVGQDGRDVLLLSILGKSDVFVLCCLFTGIVRLHATPVDGHAKLFQQGLQRAQETKSLKYSGPLPGALTKLRWRGSMVCYFHVYIVFASIATTDWNTAKVNLEALEASIQALGDSVDPLLVKLFTYLSGMFFQGTGDLGQALRLYGGQEFALPELGSPIRSAEEQVRRDLAVLAAINSLWILQCDPQRDIERNTALLERLDPYCSSNPNQEIQAAFNLTRVTVDTNTAASQPKTKTYLRAALAAAQVSKNKHLICITLNVMCDKFFGGIVGEQADKSARAASVQSKKSGNMLWMSVADGLLARSFETEGNTAEAQRAMTEAIRLADAALPHGLEGLGPN